MAHGHANNATEQDLRDAARTKLNAADFGMPFKFRCDDDCGGNGGLADFAEVVEIWIQR